MAEGSQPNVLSSQTPEPLAEAANPLTRTFTRIMGALTQFFRQSLGTQSVEENAPAAVTSRYALPNKLLRY